MMNEKDLKEYEDNIKLAKKMKKSNKYRYLTGQRYEHHGSRTYDFGDGKLPSVTTILAKTKNQEYLTAWKKKVGN